MDEINKKYPKPQSKTPLLIACIVSCLLVVSFAWMQTRNEPFLELKTQWLSEAMVPVLVVLIAGNYIKSFKVGGWEVRFNALFLGLPDIGSQAVGPAEAEYAISEEKPGPGPWFLHGTPEWTKKRENEYLRTNGLFLVHVYEPSKRPGMKYDITIFLIRHIKGDEPNQKEAFTEIDQMELYLGPSWSHQVFPFRNNGGLIGIRTSAWGTFLATAQITFKDKDRLPLILHRYIDFEMAPKPV